MRTDTGCVRGDTCCVLRATCDVPVTRANWVRCGSLLQGGDLARREISEFTGADVFVLNRPDADTAQANDLMADRFAHAAHLAIASFMDGNREQRIFA